jgi:hypothetical protein
VVERSVRADVLLEVSAVAELRDLKGPWGVRQVPEVIDPKGVRVLEPGEGERLFEKVLIGRTVLATARGASAIGRDILAKELHANDPIEPLVEGSIDRCHPARGDFVDDHVPVEKSLTFRQLRRLT